MSENRIHQIFRMRLRTVLFSALALSPLLTGCKVGPDYEKPADAAPAAWESSVAGNAAPADEAALSRWWRGLGDDRLTGLVERALAQNLDLASATARLRQARGRSSLAGAALTPSIGANGNYTRSHDPADTNPLSSNTGSWSTGLDATWELDFFGGKRRALEQADASAEAALDDSRGVRVSVAGEVALNYAARITAAKQARFARENLATSEELLRIVKVRRDAGAASELDVINAEADLSTTRAALPSYSIAETRAINALALLLAVEPAAMRREFSAEAPDIAVALPVVPAGLPSDLLRRRPDIRAAERRLHAATAGIGAAVADYFPKFNLTGTLGISGMTVGANSPSPGLAWSVGPSVSWNPFQGGAVSANVEVQKALRDDSTFAYRKAVLAALGEVETALVSCDREAERRVLLRRVLADQQRAVELTMMLYENGQTDLVTLLTTRRQLYSAQASLADSDNAAFTNLVSLYKALGGGWSEAAEPEAGASGSPGGA